MAHSNFMVVPAAQFFSFFFESLFFGIFVVLYSIALWVSLPKIRVKSTRSILSLCGVATLMLLLAGAHLTIDVVRGFDAFVTDYGVKSAFGYFTDAQKPTYIAKQFIYTTQTLLGDTVMAYRAFVVSDYNPYILLITTILLLGTAGGEHILIHHDNIF
ncbi:hypothetical protein BD310DRAFT_811819 [Dichomitus squalens]|uniref:Uncharacterized protein n=1 Tax=Dichomitus squalens TaxID=114155 RepID=A0A4Q9Q4C9_9APHY|nr:hypothetical protein BD310DRAFT_811819 [Dichomitus squalens]